MLSEPRRVFWSGSALEPLVARHYATWKCVDRRPSVQGGYSVDVEYSAILGMMAFAVWSNQELILLHPDEPSDYGEDFGLYDFRVDVKATIHPKGRLVYRYGTRHPSDLYVLAIADTVVPERTRLVGWAWHSELMRGEIKDWGNRGKPALTLSQQCLRPMEGLHGALILERVTRLGVSRYQQIQERTTAHASQFAAEYAPDHRVPGARGGPRDARQHRG